MQNQALLLDDFHVFPAALSSLPKLAMSWLLCAFKPGKILWGYELVGMVEDLTHNLFCIGHSTVPQIFHFGQILIKRLVLRILSRDLRSVEVVIFYRQHRSSCRSLVTLCEPTAAAEERQFRNFT